jgi:hypothetical protein
VASHGVLSYRSCASKQVTHKDTLSVLSFAASTMRSFLLALLFVLVATASAQKYQLQKNIRGDLEAAPGDLPDAKTLLVRRLSKTGKDDDDDGKGGGKDDDDDGKGGGKDDDDDGKGGGKKDDDDS